MLDKPTESSVSETVSSSCIYVSQKGLASSVWQHVSLKFEDEHNTNWISNLTFYQGFWSCVNTNLLKIWSTYCMFDRLGWNMLHMMNTYFCLKANIFITKSCTVQANWIKLHLRISILCESIKPYICCCEKIRRRCSHSVWRRMIFIQWLCQSNWEKL